MPSVGHGDVAVIVCVEGETGREPTPQLRFQIRGSPGDHPAQVTVSSLS